MENTVLKYAPVYWDTIAQGKNIRKEFIVDKQSDEYLQLNDEVREAVPIGKSSLLIRRNQNVHDYGQLLIREQLLAVSFKVNVYFRVRRFAVVKKEYLQNALDYNLDHRRCGLPEVKLSKYITKVLEKDEVLLVLQVVTCDLESIHIKPNNSGEYVIDYIVEIH